MKVIAAEFQVSHTIPKPTGEYNKKGKPKIKGVKALGFSSGSVEPGRPVNFYAAEAITKSKAHEYRIQLAYRPEDVPLG